MAEDRHERTTAAGGPPKEEATPPGTIQMRPGQAVPGAPPVMPTLAGDPAPTSAPPPMPMMPPARYELGPEIARGGMGRVVEAVDTVLGRTVAFKEALAVDNENVRRFEREIRITARLEHPSIVPVHDAGQSSTGAPFYVMRKVSGRPLEKLVGMAETLNQRLALIPHIVNSAHAVAHAHERGIVHRDIKPSNILVGELGETIVIDWGLAKVIGEPDEHMPKPLVDLSDSLKTRAGIVFGTPGFMAPEQLRGAPVDEQCDVYALGATLYHLLSRKPPHYAKTADEMMKAAVAAAPTPIGELVTGVPPELSTIVDKALAHDPAQRYPNARALAEDLSRFLTGQLVASHHYSTREKIARFVRKNRGAVLSVSAALFALLVVGTLALIRIVDERDRADESARIARDEKRIAEEQRAETERRADELTLTQARYNVDNNPTKAVAMIKPLAKKYWREVRAIAAAAKAAGVAWSVPASKETLSLELSKDGLRALAAGNDGAVRLYDLPKRTAVTVIDVKVPVMARFADEERKIVLWHGTDLSIIDTKTLAKRDLATETAIVDLEVVGITAYWIDSKRSMWQLDLAGTAPIEIPLDEPVRSLAPSPDGRWIALSGEQHLLLYDRTQPSAPATEVTLGDTRDLGWSIDGANLAALIDQSVIDVTMTPAPAIVHRQGVGKRQFVAHGGGRMYTIGATGVAVMSRTDRVTDSTARKQLSGVPVGLSESRGGTMIAASTGGLTVMSDDGDRVLGVQAARIEGIAASPRAPYVLARLENRLLVWNLDDIQPKRLTQEPSGRAQFAGSDHVIVGGTLDAPAQWIDVQSGQARPLGTWPGLRTVAAPPDGQYAAIVDSARHMHLVVPGRDPVDISGEVELAGFASQAKLVFTTPGEGAIQMLGMEKLDHAPLLVQHPHLLGLAWGRGRHPWVAAAFVDGTLWRKNVTTGTEATTVRQPKLDLDHLTERDGKLLVAADGTVTFVHDNEIHVWHADGGLEVLAKTPKPIDDIGDAGPGHVLAFTGDNTLYVIRRDAPNQVIEAVPSIDGTSASMSPESGLIVVLDHGAIDIIDPMVKQQWTLALPTGITFGSPVISADGRRVIAQTERSLLMWTIELPTSADDTARWLDAMTNAVDDHSPGGLGWR